MASSQATTVEEYLAELPPDAYIAHYEASRQR
jgi:hypothetical protein